MLHYFCVIITVYKIFLQKVSYWGKIDIRKEIPILLSQNLPANKVSSTKLINYITEQKILENPNEFILQNLYDLFNKLNSIKFIIH